MERELEKTENEIVREESSEKPDAYYLTALGKYETRLCRQIKQYEKRFAV